MNIWIKSLLAAIRSMLVGSALFYGMVERLFSKVDSAYLCCKLSNVPDIDKANKLLISIVENYWKNTQFNC